MNENKSSPTGEAISAPLQYQTSPPLRILVVEDETAIRHSNTKILLRSGYDVDTAEDGAAAWDILQGVVFDLMLTDNKMPKMSGVELLGKMRNACMAVPVIMTTGALPEAEFARNPSIQPTAVLLKPYTSAEMLRTVKKVLREAEIPHFASQIHMNFD